MQNLIEQLKQASEYLNAGELDKSAILAKNVLQVVPDSIDATNLLAVIALRQCNYAKVIELTPQNPTAYFNLGCLYWAMGNWQATIQIWKECLDINPSYELVLEWLPKAQSEAKIAKYRGK